MSSKNRQRNRRKTMTEFVPVKPAPPPHEFIASLAQQYDVTFDTAKAIVEAEVKTANLFRNNIYQVDVRPAEVREAGWPETTWLSIKRIDRAPVGEERFRDFQQIKNMLCGPQSEGVEVYPSEDRLVDTCNQYHIFVIRSGQRFPFGFQDRAVTATGIAGTRQKPF
jgi:hypothetical protein